MINDTFPIIETERLILTEIKKEHAEDMFQYLSDPEVMKYYGISPFTTIQDALGEMDWYNQIRLAKKGIRWGVSLKESNQIIGSCGFLNWEQKHFRADIGAELSREHWGKGIMSEVFQAILSYGFQRMNLERIQAIIEPLNIASQKLAEKNGFVNEGLLRKYEYGDGKFDDLFMYSILREEFQIKKEL